MHKLRKILSDIIWLYRPYLKYGRLFVFLSLLFWAIIIPVCQMVGVYLPSTIINMLQTGRPFSTIVIVVIGMQLILMFQPLYENTFNMLCKNKMLPYIEGKLKQDVYEQAVQTDYKYINNPEYYDNYTWAVSEYANKAADAQRLVNRVISSVITIISMLAIIATLSPLAVLVTVVGTVIENIMYIRTNYYDVAKDCDIVPYDRKLKYYHRVFYMSEYAADLKSTNVKKHLMKGFEEAQNHKLDIIRSYAGKMLPWAYGGVLTFYIARTFVILNIAYGIYTGEIATVGTYITMMGAVEALKNSMNEMFYYVKDGNRLGSFARKIRSFFEIRSEIEGTSEEGACELPAEGAYSICFEHVHFQYENSKFQIKDFHLTIQPGEKVAIVGENGVGKSTLMKLLLRFYDVDSGRILINGKDIRSYDLNKLRRSIGVAFQHSNVYAMSFEENICVYDEVAEEQLAGAMDKANLHKVLQKNCADLTTNVTREFDEHGIMLSGGEVQRIGIARLLTKDFGLRLLDEPSSALDPLAEYEMTKLILDSGELSTTIIVSHRLSTIRNVDKIVLVDAGTVAEMGTHEELMALQGKYYEMFTKQAENYVLE